MIRVALLLAACAHRPKLPSNREAVRDAMPALFNLIERESEPSVRPVMGHWLFGYMHPRTVKDGWRAF
jgi:hypothetical protein